MDRNMHFPSFSNTLQHIFSHAAVTLLAVGIAFSLPLAAKFILYTWWPMVAGDSHLLLIAEIGFAAVLVLLFNLVLIAREGRRSLRLAGACAGRRQLALALEQPRPKQPDQQRAGCVGDVHHRLRHLRL